MKKIIVSMCCIILFISGTFSLTVNAANVEPFAWPGRPGGSGTGSEEWLQGEYGEDTGVWTSMNTIKGEVADLNNNKSAALDAATLILGGVINVTAPEIVSYITANQIREIISYNAYEGNYYILKSYWSGRCVKILIYTYTNADYSGYVKTYTEWVKW